MKVWLWVLGIIAAMWSGIWFMGAAATERVMGDWLEARAAEGWLVNYESLETGGYPNRFQTRMVDLQLADPETGWAWTAPEFRLIQASYQPQRIEAIWPNSQSLASPFERLDIASGEMAAVLHVRPGTDLELAESEVVMSQVGVTSTEGWQMALTDGVFRATREEEGDATYAVLFEANALTPPEPWQAVLNPAGVLPDAVDLMRFEAVMGFDRPWDLSALERARPGITSIDLADLSANWGELSLRLAGQMEVDADGYPTGEVSVRAQNWREMVVMAVNAGVIPEEAQGGIEGVLGLVAGLSGRDSDIDAPLQFRDQRVFFGPFPIGEAPRLILR